MFFSSHRIEIIGLHREEHNDSSIVFETLATFETFNRVITLDGDICATSNDTTEIRIINWRTKQFIILKYDDPAIADTIVSVVPSNTCLHLLHPGSFQAGEVSASCIRS